MTARKAGAPTREALFATLGEWADAGWLRWLDLAFARFVADECPLADATTIASAAFVAHAEGRGHTCIELERFVADPAAWMGWSGDARDALEASLSRLPRRADAWIARLLASGAVHRSDELLDDGAPLVLDGARLYLRRFWNDERTVAAQVLARSHVRAAIDADAARRWIDRLFDARADDATTDWQRVACALALDGGLSIVTGGPGTGKTWTAARLLALLFALSPDRELRVALAAPTGKAAARLRQSIDEAMAALAPRVGDALPLATIAARLGGATTLHRLLGARHGSRRFRHGASSPLDVDVVIVDEASMIHLEMMARLLVALPAHARVVLLGDKDQLASVEAGAVLGDLCAGAERGRYRDDTVRRVATVASVDIDEAFVDATGPALAQRTTMLRTGRRFGSGIGRLAAAVNDGDAARAAELLDDATESSVSWLVATTPERAVDLAVDGYRAFVDAVAARPVASDAHAAWARDVLAAFDRCRLLCAVREGAWGVRGLNDAVERRLALAGDASDWYEGRPVIVTRNDAGLGVYNGDVGVALRAADGRSLRVHFADGAALRVVGASRLVDVETAFAMTVHKAQGSEFGHAVLVLPPERGRVATRELVYTGVTRARERLTLVTADRGALDAALAQRTQRASGLAERLDVVSAATRPSTRDGTPPDPGSAAHDRGPSS